MVGERILEDKGSVDQLGGVGEVGILWNSQNPRQVCEGCVGEVGWGECMRNLF